MFGGVDTNPPSWPNGRLSATGRNGRVVRVGIEGGSYGAGLARYLTEAGVEVTTTESHQNKVGWKQYGCFRWPAVQRPKPAPRP